MAKKKGDWLPYLEDGKIKGCRIPKALLILPIAILVNWIAQIKRYFKRKGDTN